MNTTAPAAPVWHEQDSVVTAAQQQLEAEIKKIESEAARQRAETASRLAAENRKISSWRSILNSGAEAATRTRYAREQLEIMRERKSIAEAKLRELIGEPCYSLEWHSQNGVSPTNPAQTLFHSPEHGSTPQNPIFFWSRRIAETQPGLEFIEKLIPQFEQAEADALASAKAYAAAHGIEHDFGDTTPTTASSAAATEPANALAELTVESTPKRRK